MQCSSFYIITRCLSKQCYVKCFWHAYITLRTDPNMLKINLDQGVHDHDVLVDLLHFPEGDKMQISSKLEHYYANEIDKRNQRPRDVGKEITYHIKC